MKYTYKSIIQNHLHRIHADVSMAAYSETAPNWKQESMTTEFHRLFLIMEGECLVNLGERSFHAKPGHLFWIPTGLIHSFGTYGTERLGWYWCHFRANLGDAKMFELLNLPFIIDVDEPEKVRSLFRSMIDSFKSDKLTRGLRVNAALFELISAYVDRCELAEENLACTETFGKLNDALQYIEEHLSENILLEDLAKAVFLHPNYFIGIFKSAIGCSPIQYVNQRKLERAKQLLADSYLSVAEVSASVGMQNHYLSRLFKQHTGLSPSRFRQIYRVNARDLASGGEAELLETVQPEL
jgi:AraC family transcriptional regulator of arabinose operon